MEDIPCSRVGHIYRKYVPYKVPTGVSLARVSGSDVSPHPACDQTAASWKVLQSKSSSIFSISSYKRCPSAMWLCYCLLLPHNGRKIEACSTQIVLIRGSNEAVVAEEDV